jgi:MraZ protein
MTPFMGTHQSKLDAKGRVSIPAAFRAVLRSNAAEAGQAEFSQIILRPSHKHACLEAWPPPEFHRLAAPLDQYDIFSEPHDDLAATLYADAYPIETDKEGRIILPAELAAHAGIADNLVFVGHGRIFQIWEPAAALRRRMAARDNIRLGGITLPGTRPPSPAAIPPGPGASA